jgi:hypothetical protein
VEEDDEIWLVNGQKIIFSPFEDMGCSCAIRFGLWKERSKNRPYNRQMRCGDINIFGRVVNTKRVMKSHIKWGNGYQTWFKSL